MSKGLMPEFTTFMTGLNRDLKNHGKGDTEHHAALDDRSMAKIFTAIAVVTNVFNFRGTDEFMLEVEKLPAEYQTNFQKWLHMCVQFLICLFDMRRGSEGLRKLTKTHFVKEYDEELDLYYYRRGWLVTF